MQSESPASAQWRPSAIWLAVAAYFLFVSFGSNLLELHYSYLDSSAAGSWGLSFAQQGPDAVVQTVEPGSNAAALGIRPGDRLRSDEPFTFRKIPLAGETLRFVRISPGPAKPLQFVAPRADPPPMAVSHLLDRVIDDAVRIALGLGGLFILWRGSKRRSGFLLGLAFLSMSAFPPPWLPFGRYSSYFWDVGVFSLFYLEFGLLLPLFAIAFLAEAGVRPPGWARALFWAGIGLTLFCYGFVVALPPGVFSGATYALANQVRVPMTEGLFILTMAILAVGWRRGTAGSRHRFAMLLLAIGLIFLSNILFVIFDSLARTNPRLLTYSASICRILGSLLFAYAALRHKVVDLGFTVNRTLVYGGVSAILLAAFGLVEWGLHQLLELEGWQGSALLSAVLAVAIVLGFHPVRHFVEHYVSSIFFRPWRDKERALRRFVDEGGFFTDPGRLAAAFAGALEQYSGARCCVYRRTDEGVFVCAAGTMPPAHADDAVAVTLRAQGKVCEIEHGASIIDGALAFPMIHCHDLEGFAVLGRKPGGEQFRPDEVDLVEWATRQIGQDLYGLAVGQLRAERDARDREIAVLTGRNADLQLALANRSAPARLRRAPAKAATIL